MSKTCYRQRGILITAGVKGGGHFIYFQTEKVFSKLAKLGGNRCSDLRIFSKSSKILKYFCIFLK